MQCCKPKPRHVLAAFEEGPEVPERENRTEISCIRLKQRYTAVRDCFCPVRFGKNRLNTIAFPKNIIFFVVVCFFLLYPTRRQKNSTANFFPLSYHSHSHFFHFPTGAETVEPLTHVCFPCVYTYGDCECMDVFFVV